jgi:predicted phosphodiesterase
MSVRTAVLYDVHGNLAALEAVLAEVDAAGVDRLASGGDVALFGPQPAACVDRLRSLGEWLVAIRGNTDRYIAERTRPSWSAWPEDAATWTRDALGADRIAWLEAQPATMVLEEHTSQLVHATVSSDEDVILPETPDAEAARLLGPAGQPRVLYGHVHIQYRRRLGEVELVNPGSVGLPFDGDRRAAWAILDGDRVELRRTAYDADAVVDAVEEAHPPGWQQTVDRLRNARG